MQFSDDEIEIEILRERSPWNPRFGLPTTCCEVTHKPTGLTGCGMIKGNSFEINLHNAKLDLAKKIKALSKRGKQSKLSKGGVPR